MVNLIVDVSRYLMILLIAVYTWLNFRYFSFRDEGKQKKICGRQNRCMFLIHFLAYGILWLKTGDERILAFYVAQVVFFSVLHLRLPPVLPQCFTSFGQQYVYAAQRGLYHFDAAVL